MARKDDEKEFQDAWDEVKDGPITDAVQASQAAQEHAAREFEQGFISADEKRAADEKVKKDAAK